VSPVTIAVTVNAQVVTEDPMSPRLTPSIRWLPLVGLLMADSGAALAQVRLPTAPPAPSSLTAASAIPTQIVLTWPAVTGANGYRITYVDNHLMVQETQLYEGRSGSFAIDPTKCTNGAPCTYIHLAGPLPYLYSYRVWAIFYSTIGPLISDPGPVARATPAPFGVPTNFTYSIAPSTVKPGLIDLTVNWSPVTNAARYSAKVDNGKGFWNIQTVGGPSVRFDQLRAKGDYTVCVYSIYLSQINGATISDPKATGCLPLTL
jgi:hypothetical protein